MNDLIEPVSFQPKIPKHVFSFYKKERENIENIGDWFTSKNMPLSVLDWFLSTENPNLAKKRELAFLILALEGEKSVNISDNSSGLEEVEFKIKPETEKKIREYGFGHICHH